MKTALLALLLTTAAGWQAAAQVPAFDSSGNGLLNGQYYFRELSYAIGDAAADASDAVVLYGTITFNGNGTYTGSATGFQASQGAGTITISGSYSISASGYGFLSHPLFSGVSIYGLVSQGVFVASSTEGGFNDLFVAAQISSPAPTLSTLKGSYSIADMDFTLALNQGSVYTIGSTFQLNPDGAGNVSVSAVSGYLGGGGTSVYSQPAQSTKYSLSNSAYSMTLSTASSATLLAGQKLIYISPDGNFIFGGSPVNGSTPFDMFVGVRAAGTAPNLNGLYYQAGMDEDFSSLASTGYTYLESYFGSFTAASGSIIGHQRRQDALFPNAFDSTYPDAYTVKSDGTYSTTSMKYVVGAGGTRIGSGIGPLLGINVALAAPLLSGTGVFLSPQGVQNAGSFAPFTAGIAPGELLFLSGSGLSNSSNLVLASTVPLPTTLAGVQVLINGAAAPLYYVSPSAISALVPYSTTTSVAQVQVVNNGSPSNVVTVFTNKTAPGVFTASSSGQGLGAVLHSDYTTVTEAHPAQVGETVSVFLTGLGAVIPAVPDGSVAPTGPYSLTVNTISAFIGGIQASVGYAGLAPGSAALYQVNLTIPTGVTTGDQTLEIVGPDSDTTLALIPVAPASTAAGAEVVVAPVRRPAILQGQKPSPQGLPRHAFREPHPDRRNQ
ncbi:MAG TPA: hypothetical protein VMH81_34845 [Bryobacteraceae bacterium]|nr:hypothetical protein [Bryobacteraceae bacterium]